jgi:geranylgeranyl diphosphate synthase, type II
MKFQLNNYLKQNQALINKHLDLILDKFNSDRELIKAMRHSLMAGGKRLRPTLSLAAAHACCEDSELLALPAACAIEFIHTYSLIHDDLPAMDNDDLRRGQPTCHKKFSESTAILAGDALLTHAFYILSRPESIFETYPDTHIRMQLIAKISEAAGISGMVEGQIMDMQLEKKQLTDDSIDILKELHSLKTGKMLITSLECGAISVDADRDKIKALALFGEKIGLAFQIIDDILDIEGDPKKMGKPTGSDDELQKTTFPALMGIEASGSYANTLIKEAQDSLSFFDKKFDEKAEPLRAIAEYIINRDH